MILIIAVARAVHIPSQANNCFINHSSSIEVAQTRLCSSWSYFSGIWVKELIAARVVRQQQCL